MSLFKPVVVCVSVIAFCGCDQGQPKPPVAANNPAPAETKKPPAELSESASAIGMKFKLIPAGTFTMGDGDKAHVVAFTEPFQIGVHEVTQAQYEQVISHNPSGFKSADNPVESVSWNDAVEFCRKLSQLPAEMATGNAYRLPTEAESEYACRAGTTTKYSFGNDRSELGQYAWYFINNEKKTRRRRQAARCLGAA